MSSAAKQAPLSPPEQIVMVMKRIYDQGLTTLSGGNLSIRMADGAVWMTPSGVDKGNLRPEDILCVHPDGRIEGQYRPSSEGLMHHAIYALRPDVQAIVHAHPPALMTGCVTRSLPETRLLPQPYQAGGGLAFADYAIPGGQALADLTARPFGEGCDAVLMANHGTTVVGPDLFSACQRMEVLERCTRTQIDASHLGPLRLLTPEQLAWIDEPVPSLPEFEVKERPAGEAALREQIAALMRRACARGLMGGLQGVISARLDAECFLITPSRCDRPRLEAADLVLICEGCREAGAHPSRMAALHRAIYEAQPGVQAILSGQPSAVCAFAVTETPFDTRIHIEGFGVLRDPQRFPFDALRESPQFIAHALGPESPVALIENYGLVVVGANLLQAFDRLEVAEFTARTLIDARRIGALSGLPEAEIERLLALLRGQ